VAAPLAGQSAPQCGPPGDMTPPPAKTCACWGCVKGATNAVLVPSDTVDWVSLLGSNLVRRDISLSSSAARWWFDTSGFMSGRTVNVPLSPRHVFSQISAVPLSAPVLPLTRSRAARSDDRHVLEVVSVASLFGVVSERAVAVWHVSGSGPLPRRVERDLGRVASQRSICRCCDLIVA